MPRVLSLVALVAIMGLVSAQSPLTTTFAANNGQAGNMFDLVGIAPVVITGFDLNLDVGSWNIDIYTKAGPYLPDVFNAGAWGAPIATYLGVAGAGLNLVTPLPQNLSVAIGAAATQSFYVTVTNGTGLNYLTGVAGTTGTVFAQNADLQFLSGAGMSYPFGSNFNPRVFSGNIYYLPGGPPTYQTNSANASLDVNGVQSSGFAPAVSNVCPGATNTGTVAGGPSSVSYDIGFTVGTTVLPNNLVTTGGQIVNLDFLSPSFGFVFGGTLAPFAPFSVPIVFGPGTPELDAQMVILDFIAPDGFTLSQAVCIQTLTATTSIAGPSGDDVFQLVDLNLLAGSPNCWDVSSLPFYGSSFTQFNVASNGRVMMGAGSTDWTPTIAEALSGVPFVGNWSDLSVNIAGSITISNPGSGLVSVAWAGVPFFGQAGSSSSFSVDFDGNTGVVALNGLQGILPATALGAAADQFLGMSPGTLLGATDPGVAGFAPAAAGAAGAPGDMLYELNLGLSSLRHASITAGLNAVVFTPAGSNYTWVGL